MTTGATPQQKGAHDMTTQTDHEPDSDSELTPAERFQALSPDEQEALLAGGTWEPLDTHGGEQITFTGEPQQVPHFVVDDDEGDDPDEPGIFTFTLGRKGDAPEDARLLYAHRPKTAILMQFATIDPKSQDIGLLVNMTNLFLDSVLDRASRDYVRSRLLDPDDNWDIDMLVPVIHRLKGRWYGRPTGPATGASGSPGFSWQSFDGSLTLTGQDAATLSPRRLCSALHRVVRAAPTAAGRRAGTMAGDTAVAHRRGRPLPALAGGAAHAGHRRRWGACHGVRVPECRHDPRARRGGRQAGPTGRAGVRRRVGRGVIPHV